MTGISRVDGSGASDEPAVRQPAQRRTREQWRRILDAGVRLLEEGGYEAFTIAALCQTAGVPPRALYARAATKDVLFLAVYEHGMSRVRAGHERFAELGSQSLDDERLVQQAVAQVVQIFLDNSDFLRAIVLISAAHPEVRRRGEAYRAMLGELFTTALSPLRVSTRGGDPARERAFCFSVVFSALVVRTAYGPGFDVVGDEKVLTEELVTLAQRYLLA